MHQCKTATMLCFTNRLGNDCTCRAKFEVVARIIEKRQIRDIGGLYHLRQVASCGIVNVVNPGLIRLKVRNAPFSRRFNVDHAHSIS